MEREEIVRVRVKGGGAAAFAAGQKYALKLGAGATADKWDGGAPITRAEFDAVLAPTGIFEVAEEKASPQRAQRAAEI